MDISEEDEDEGEIYDEDDEEDENTLTEDQDYQFPRNLQEAEQRFDQFHEPELPGDDER